METKCKLLTLEEITIKLVNSAQSKTLTGGVYDLLHYGHLVNLEKCAKFADLLIVHIASDKSVKTRKGPERPIITETHRALMVAALPFVDYVYIADLSMYDPRIIEAIKPEYFVVPEKAEDTVSGLKEKKNAFESNFKYCEMVFLKETENISTSKIISKIKAL